MTLSVAVSGTSLSIECDDVVRPFGALCPRQVPERMSG
jgi:hypothetical protein